MNTRGLNLFFKRVFSETVPDFLLFGEFHGVRENLEILKTTVEFSTYELRRPTTLVLEWPERLTKELNNFIFNRTRTLRWKKWPFAKNPDGRISKDFLSFLGWLRLLNLKVGKKFRIRIVCVDKAGEVWRNATWNQRDRWMGQNTLYVSRKNPQALVICMWGNIHANKKKKLIIQGKERVPAASYLPARRTVSIKLRYLSGSFFNIGLRRIKTSSKIKFRRGEYFKIREVGLNQKEFTRGFDYEIIVRQAHSVRLLGKFNRKTSLIDIK